MSAKESCLEDFNVGEKAVSPGRTVIEADVVVLAGISGDWNKLRTNAIDQSNSQKVFLLKRAYNFDHFRLIIAWQEGSWFGEIKKA